MADRIYLHVGAPKTGTSFLQLMLWEHREQLEADGVRLPLGKRRAHFDAVGDVRGGMWKDPDSRWSWQGLVEDVHAHPGTAVVSEELLCGASAEQVSAMVGSLAPAQVHVVMTARDYVRQVPAVWQQAVRARSPQRFGQWLERMLDDPDAPFWQMQDPVRVLERWGGSLPPEQVHLVTLPPAGHDPRILWDRFCAVLDVDPNRYTGEPSSTNASLGAAEAELLRRVNVALGSDLPLRKPYLSVVRRYLTQPVLMTSPTGVRFGVAEEHAKFLHTRAEQSIEAVAAAGWRVTGDLDDLVPESSRHHLSPDEVTDEAIAETAVASIARTLVHLDEVVTEQRRRLRRENARLRRTNQRLREQVATPSVAAGRLRSTARRVRRAIGR